MEIDFESTDTAEAETSFFSEGSLKSTFPQAQERKSKTSNAFTTPEIKINESIIANDGNIRENIHSSTDQRLKFKSPHRAKLKRLNYKYMKTSRSRNSSPRYHLVRPSTFPLSKAEISNPSKAAKAPHTKVVEEANDTVKEAKGNKLPLTDESTQVKVTDYHTVYKLRNRSVKVRRPIKSSSIHQPGSPSKSSQAEVVTSNSPRTLEAPPIKIDGETPNTAKKITENICPSDKLFSKITSTGESQECQFIQGGIMKKLKYQTLNRTLKAGMSSCSSQSHSPVVDPSTSGKLQVALSDPSKANKASPTEVDGVTTDNVKKIVRNTYLTTAKNTESKSLNDPELYKLRGPDKKVSSSIKSSPSQHPVNALPFLEAQNPSKTWTTPQIKRYESHHIAKKVMETTHTSTYSCPVLRCVKSSKNSHKSQHPVTLSTSSQEIEVITIDDKASDTANLYPKLESSQGAVWKKLRYCPGKAEISIDSLPNQRKVNPSISQPLQEVIPTNEDSLDPTLYYHSTLEEAKDSMASMKLDARHVERVAQRKVLQSKLSADGQYNNTVFIPPIIQPGVRDHPPRYPPTFQIRQEEVQTIMQRNQTPYDAKFEPPSVQSHVKQVPLARHEFRQPVNTKVPNIFSQDIPEEIYYNRQERTPNSNPIMSGQSALTQMKQIISKVPPISSVTDIKITGFELEKPTDSMLQTSFLQLNQNSASSHTQKASSGWQKLGSTSNMGESSTSSKGFPQEIYNNRQEWRPTSTYIRSRMSSQHAPVYPQSLMQQEPPNLHSRSSKLSYDYVVTGSIPGKWANPTSQSILTKNVQPEMKSNVQEMSSTSISRLPDSNFKDSD